MGNRIPRALWALCCWGTLIASGSMAGCASVSPLSGAKTLKAGTSEIAVGLEAVLPANEDGEAGSDVPVGFGPVFSYRHGLSDRVDASVRLYFIGASADVRLALLKGRFSASLGAQVSASSVGVSIADSSDEFSASTVELPLYLEYALSSSFSILAVPRVGIARIGSDGDTKTTTLALLAIGIPIKIGGLGILPSLTSGYYGDSPIVGSALGFSF